MNTVPTSPTSHTTPDATVTQTATTLVSLDFTDLSTSASAAYNTAADAQVLEVLQAQLAR